MLLSALHTLERVILAGRALGPLGTSGATIPRLFSSLAPDLEGTSISELATESRRTLKRILSPRTIGAEKSKCSPFSHTPLSPCILCNLLALCPPSVVCPVGSRVLTAFQVGLEKESDLHSRLLDHGFSVLDARVSKDYQQCYIIWNCFEKRRHRCERILEAGMQRLKTSAARQFKKRKLPRFEMIFDDSDGVEALITASRHPIEEEEEEKEDEFLVINTRQRDSNDGSVDEGSTAHEHPPALMRHLGLKEAHAHLLGDLSFHDLLQLHRTGKLVRLVCERDARAGRRPKSDMSESRV